MKILRIKLINELAKCDCNKTLTNVFNHVYTIDMQERNKVNEFIKDSIRVLRLENEK